MRIPPFRLERYFAEHEFNVDYVLCASDCESLTIGDLVAREDGADEKLRQQWLGYTESTGSPGLRREICQLYQTIEPHQVLVHSGAEEAIFLFMHALLEPDDHIIVHWPCYQSLFEVARSIGCRVTRWEAREEDGWSLDLDALVGQIGPHTKAIVVNTPHNPTGYLMPRQVFRELNRVAETHGIVLFSDEVYRGLEYSEQDRLPAACDLSDRAVSVGVMSKTYGLAGLRIGWVVTHDAEISARMAALKDYTTICNSAPSEFLAQVALRHRKQLVERNLGIIGANLAVLDGFFQRHADRFAWQRPDAGPIAFPRLMRGDVEAFCDAMVQTASVLLLPGSVYDDNGHHFRIGFGRKHLPAALARLEEGLQAFHEG